MNHSHSFLFLTLTPPLSLMLHGGTQDPAVLEDHSRRYIQRRGPYQLCTKVDDDGYVAPTDRHKHVVASEAGVCMACVDVLISGFNSGGEEGCHEKG
jgi:hypothetical protein